jgi:hypothetical protein
VAYAAEHAVFSVRHGVPSGGIVLQPLADLALVLIAAPDVCTVLWRSKVVEVVLTSKNPWNDPLGTGELTTIRRRSLTESIW